MKSTEHNDNFYLKILKKLDRELKLAQTEWNTGRTPLDPKFLGYINTLQYYMSHKDQEFGFFAAQVILEDWFLGENDGLG
jgi:hypothetical protein